MALVLLLSACSAATAPATAPARGASGAPQSASAAMVEPAGGPAQDWSFRPVEVRVAMGGTVTWTNQGETFHTVTSDDAGKTFDSHVVNPRETFTFTFAQTGTFPYHCDLHPWMKGVVRACDGFCP